MTVVLGIDPGLIKTGFGVVESVNNTLVYINSGTIFTDTKLTLELRLSNIFNELTKIIETYNPEVISIEETFVNNNPMSSLKLGEARGIAVLVAGLNNIPLYEYKPNMIKKTISGAGKAGKEQIKTMVKFLLPLAKPKTEDESDALAIAICHIHNNKLFNR